MYVQINRFVYILGYLNKRNIFTKAYDYTRVIFK